MDVVPLEGLQLSDKLAGVFINQARIEPLPLQDKSPAFNIKRFQRRYRKASIGMLAEVSPTSTKKHRAVTNLERGMHWRRRQHTTCLREFLRIILKQCTMLDLLLIPRVKFQKFSDDYVIILPSTLFQIWQY